jgi:cyanuric acid amidohydrolase
MRTVAIVVPAGSPTDTSGLGALFEAKKLAAREVCAVFGRAGGDAADAAELARAIRELVARRSSEAEEALARRLVLDVRPGPVGLTPHLFVLGRRDDEATLVPGHARLAVGVARTRAFAPHEIGRMPQILETARVVEELTRSLEVDSPADVHLVHVAAALPALGRGEADRAVAEGRPLRGTASASRAASALGVAVATREVSARDLDDGSAGSRWDLATARASLGDRPGSAESEIVVLANSPKWSGELVAASAAIADLLDADATRGPLASLGLHAPLGVEERRRIVGCLVSIDGAPPDRLRDRPLAREVGAAPSTTIAAVLASVLGDPAITVSATAEHVGPRGGGALCLVARY